jgi:hypothetical protein
VNDLWEGYNEDASVAQYSPSVMNMLASSIGKEPAAVRCCEVYRPEVSHFGSARPA